MILQDLHNPLHQMLPPPQFSFGFYIQHLLRHLMPITPPAPASLEHTSLHSTQMVYTSIHFDPSIAPTTAPSTTYHYLSGIGPSHIPPMTYAVSPLRTGAKPETPTIYIHTSCTTLDYYSTTIHQCASTPPIAHTPNQVLETSTVAGNTSDSSCKKQTEHNDIVAANQNCPYSQPYYLLANIHTPCPHCSTVCRYTPTQWWTHAPASYPAKKPAKHTCSLSLHRDTYCQQSRPEFCKTAAESLAM